MAVDLEGRTVLHVLAFILNVSFKPTGAIKARHAASAVP